MPLRRLPRARTCYRARNRQLSLSLQVVQRRAMTRKLYSWLYLSHNTRHVHNAVYFWQLKDLQVGFKGVGIWDHDVVCRLGQVRKFGNAQTACRKAAGHIVSQVCFHSLIRNRSCPFAIPVSVPTLHAVASYRKQVGQHGRKLFLMQCVFCSTSSQ